MIRGKQLCPSVISHKELVGGENIQLQKCGGMCFERIDYLIEKLNVNYKYVIYMTGILLLSSCLFKQLCSVQWNINF